MTYSEVKITFNEDLQIGSRLLLAVGDSTAFLGIIIFERWVYYRTNSNQVTIGSPTNIIGERAAINFLSAFNLDYNSTGIYVTQRVQNEVTIKSTSPFLSFADGSATMPGISGNPATLLNVIFEYNNFSDTIFSISSIDFEQAVNPCTHIKVNVTTSELATQVTSPIVITPNANNPFSFEVLRGNSVQVNCESSTGDMASQLVNLPDVLDAGNISFTINNSPGGATVIINISVSFGLNLEYSLDDVTWQPINTFNGLGTDNYTLYVKDQFGCKVTKTFVVDDFGIQNPYFLISKSNAIRFANRIQWSDCANYKNDENTLSCEADVPLPYTEIQQFQSCDMITTQFQSNYDTVLAVAIEEDGNEMSLNIEQKTNNMRLTDLRDARKFNLGNGKTGIYFINGNIYNYDTGIDTGENYTLNGGLPVWAVVGNYIRLSTSWFLIEDIIYNESRHAEVIVIDNTYTGIDVIVQVASTYNLFNYEVYEFTIDMFNFLNQTIQVRISNSDNSFDNLVHVSEKINVKIRQENTIEIRYKNNTNTDIFYATGIEHKIRIPIDKINSKIEENNETYKTDTTALLLSSEVYEVDEFVFEPITKQMMRKLVQAFSHSDVKIDGVSYVKSGDIETEGALEDTNLYIVKAVMIKTANVYNSQTGDGSNQFASGATEIPGLIDSGDGFVIY